MYSGSAVRCNDSLKTVAEVSDCFKVLLLLELWLQWFVYVVASASKKAICELVLYTYPTEITRRNTTLRYWYCRVCHLFRVTVKTGGQHWLFIKMHTWCPPVLITSIVTVLMKIKLPSQALRCSYQYVTSGTTLYLLTWNCSPNMKKNWLSVEIITEVHSQQDFDMWLLLSL